MPEPNPASSPAWAVVARILRPQGLRGEVVADILTSFPEKFAERSRLYLLPAGADSPASREVTLENHRFPSGRNSGRVILKFSGLDSIEQIEPLAGIELAVPYSERAILDADEYYVADLTGCVLEANGAEIGRVEDVDMASSATPLLVVKSASGEEYLLPLAKALLDDVDTGARRIRMTLPEGLLDINRPEEKPPAAPRKPRPVPKWKLRRDAAAALKATAALKASAAKGE